MGKSSIHLEHICNWLPPMASITQPLGLQEPSEDEMSGDIFLLFYFPTTYMYEDDSRSVLRSCRNCQELQSRCDGHVSRCESVARCWGVKRINEAIEDHCEYSNDDWPIHPQGSSCRTWSISARRHLPVQFPVSVHYFCLWVALRQHW